MKTLHLSQRQREAIHLREVDGHNFVAIAARFGVTRERARQLYLRAVLRRDIAAGVNPDVGSNTILGWLLRHATEDTDSGLITRTANGLTYADITVDMLPSLTIPELMRQPNIGRKAVALIEQCLLADGGKTLADRRLEQIGKSVRQQQVERIVNALTAFLGTNGVVIKPELLADLVYNELSR